MQAAQPQQRKTEHSCPGERHRKRKNRTCYMIRKQKRKQPRPEASRRAAHQRQSETPHRTQRKAGRMMQNGKIKNGRSCAAQQHREKIPVNAERRFCNPSAFSRPEVIIW